MPSRMRSEIAIRSCAGGDAGDFRIGKGRGHGLEATGGESRAQRLLHFRNWRRRETRLDDGGGRPGKRAGDGRTEHGFVQRVRLRNDNRSVLQDGLSTPDLSAPDELLAVESQVSPDVGGKAGRLAWGYRRTASVFRCDGNSRFGEEASEDRGKHPVRRPDAARDPIVGGKNKGVRYFVRVNDRAPSGRAANDVEPAAPRRLNSLVVENLKAANREGRRREAIKADGRQTLAACPHIEECFVDCHLRGCVSLDEGQDANDYGRHLRTRSRAARASSTRATGVV